MTNSLLALRGRHAQLSEKYVHSTGSMEYHYRLAQQMREIREEIQGLSRPQTVVDYDGTFEGRLVNGGVKFSVNMIQVGGEWVAEITVGMVN